MGNAVLVGKSRCDIDSRKRILHLFYSERMNETWCSSKLHRIICWYKNVINAFLMINKL